MSKLLTISFLYPSFLWALLLLAIPIIIHLFNFRKYKTLDFPNIALLKNIQNKSKKSRTLKETLILLTRLLAITCLILAFAFPFSNSEKTRSSESIYSLYIDNSLSMDQNGIEGHKLDVAKTYADELLNQIPKNSKIHLVTNHFNPENRILISPKVAQQKISQIKPSFDTRTFQEVLNYQLNFLHNYSAYNRHSFWISDFQHIDKNKLINRDSLDIQCFLIESAENNNLSIDSIYFTDAKRKMMGDEDLIAKVTNHGQQDVNDVNITLSVNKSIYKKNISIAPKTSINIQFNYKQPNDSLVNGFVEISDNSYKHDNQFFFGYQLTQERKVLLITSNEEVIKTVSKIYKNDKSIEVEVNNPKNINYSKLQTKDFVILGELKQIPAALLKTLKEAESTTTLLLPPSGQLNESYSFSFDLKEDTVGKEINWIDKSSDLFAGVFTKDNSKDLKEDFPVNKSTHKINTLGQTIIKHEDGSAYLVRNDNLFIAASGLSTKSSNLSNNALVVPLFYQLTYLAAPILPVSYDIKKNQTVLTNKTKSTSLTMKGENYNYLLNVNNNTVQLPNDINTPSWYFLVDERNKTNTLFGLNTSRKESLPLTDQKEVLNSKAERDELRLLEVDLNNTNFQSVLSDKADKYWTSILLFSLLFLGIEMILKRIKFKMN